ELEGARRGAARRLQGRRPRGRRGPPGGTLEEGGAAPPDRSHQGMTGSSGALGAPGGREVSEWRLAPRERGDLPGEARLRAGRGVAMDHAGRGGVVEQRFGSPEGLDRLRWASLGDRGPDLLHLGTKPRRVRAVALAARTVVPHLLFRGLVRRHESIDLL